MKNIMYFENDGGENCSILEEFEQRIEDGEKEIMLQKAVMCRGGDAFYCMACGECMTRDVGQCGRVCVDYKPRNRKNGRCVNHRNCYEADGEDLILTKDGLKKLKIKK